MAANRQQKSKPERKIKIGFITATVWRNESNGRIFRSVDLARSFKTDGGYGSNSTFTLSDLPLAIEALRLAQDYVAEQEAVVE